MACEKLYYTLRIASDLAQDVPALDIGRFADGFEPPSPSVIGNIGAIAFTPAQVPMVGGALTDRLEWAIACQLTEAESAQLAALYAWQQRQLQKALDARLEWIDRFEPTEPAPLSELSRDIINAQTTPYGYTYGFPVVTCLISKPTRQLIGSKNGAPLRLCTFSVTEHR